MAEVVGLVASILQLVDTVAKARNYIDDFRNARKDQKKLLLEIQNLQPFITELHQGLTGSPSAGAIGAAQKFQKPLDQLEGTMKRLAKKLDPPSTTRRISTRLTWTLWTKDEVREGLDTIERCKSLLGVWLGMDIWSAQLHTGFPALIFVLIRDSAQSQTRRGQQDCESDFDF
jgi:hypothetical protein